MAGASVFAFVGLNESGKTTVLEAIHSFAPDEATSELLGGDEGLGVPFTQRVPRHLLSEFTGSVAVTATIAVSPEDRIQIRNRLKKAGIEVDLTTIPNEIKMERLQTFENGDFKNSFFSVLKYPRIKTGKQRKWRTPDTSQERISIRDAIFADLPRIAYFPTFVFEFPKSIFLTERGTLVDKFYRSVFQDILDYDGRGQTIDKDIVRRIRRDEMIVPWASFWNYWSPRDDRDKIQQVMDRASAVVTSLVFGRWNTIFREDTRGKEVSISYEIVEGELEDAQGTKRKTNEHDVQVKFQIKDGTRRFDVNDRSLGFRWFFSFMLFTQFRVARAAKGAPPLLFLFDEPASNLHAQAQQKLVECFPAIAKNGHLLIYSTHSHYMIDPKWLEQTFIVTNRSDAPESSILDQLALDDESLDVRVSTYRSFVNDHPSRTSYFQPILDRLEVIPSKFDMNVASVVLEGKSDYYIIRYMQKMLNKNELSLIPGLGAGTFATLASFHVGWNLNFIFLLDGDAQGKKERNRYHTDYGIPLARLLTLDELVTNAAVIEDILDIDARKKIQSDLGIKALPNKSQICRYFQEKLASDDIEILSKQFEISAKEVVNQLAARLS